MERIKWVDDLACCSKCPGVWPLIMVKQPIEHYALHRKEKCEHCDDGEVDDHERCQHCDGAGGTVVASA